MAQMTQANLQLYLCIFVFKQKPAELKYLFQCHQLPKFSTLHYFS